MNNHVLRKLNFFSVVSSQWWAPFVNVVKPSMEPHIDKGAALLMEMMKKMKRRLRNATFKLKNNTFCKKCNGPL